MRMVSTPVMIGQSNDRADEVTGAADASTRPGPLAEPLPTPEPVDPTRYGDWEKNGRCIDF